MPGIGESGPKRNAVVIGCFGCVPNGSGTAPEGPGQRQSMMRRFLSKGGRYPSLATTSSVAEIWWRRWESVRPQHLILSNLLILQSSNLS
jgi:hypothetical protein